MAKRRVSRPRSAGVAENRKLLLWLVCCFPLGLAMMWRRSCRWPIALKCAVTACLIAAVAAVALPQTTPQWQASGGVELVQRAPSVEIYGPELPESIEESSPGYESILYNSATSVPVPTPEPEVTVYVANNGKYYHTATCRFYQTASRSMTLYEVYFTDYKPCPECNPGVWEH